MIGLSKGVQRMIASGLVIVFCITTMFVAVQALLSTSKVGLSVNVSYDPLVTAKVYLSTNSSTAGSLRQISPTVNTDTETDFDIAKSSLVFNTKDTTPLTKDSFEALGSGVSNGLKCDASGEMEFYVYVENYSTTDTIFYQANITFTGNNEVAPFNIIENPTYISAEKAIEFGTSSIGLLNFKIKSINPTVLNVNTIQFEIKLTTSITSILNLNKYSSGNYSGLYYVDFGEYPQSEVGTTQPEGTVQVTPSPYGSNTFWVNNSTGEKFVKKSTIYYKIEPIRWLIIGNGGNYNNLLNKNYDELTNNQFLLLSEKCLELNYYHSSYVNIAWRSSSMYSTILPNIKNQFFTISEQEKLEDIYEGSASGVDYYSKFSLLSYDMAYLYTNYCTPNNLKCEFTSWCSTANQVKRYWLKHTTSFYGKASGYPTGNTYTSGNGVLNAIDINNGNNYLTAVGWQHFVRPIIILNTSLLYH
ncbi:MAG: hypothetical protein PHO33_04440 [Clostridia bacterium]|nr:hypothetical protein [Clostridia bacterium]